MKQNLGNDKVGCNLQMKDIFFMELLKNNDIV